MPSQKKQPDHPHGGPPGQGGKPPKPQQYDVRGAVVAVGVAAVDIQLTLAPPVEPPPEGTRHTVAVAATARGRVLATTRVMPAGSGSGEADLVVTVPGTGNLQAAIDAAIPGDVIVLQAGAEYRMPDAPDEP